MQENEKSLVTQESEKQTKNTPSKFWKVMKKIGSVLWLVIKCVGYLIYVLLLLWLFIDITDGFKKNKR